MLVLACPTFAAPIVNRKFYGGGGGEGCSTGFWATTNEDGGAGDADCIPVPSRGTTCGPSSECNTRSRSGEISGCPARVSFPSGIAAMLEPAAMCQATGIAAMRDKTLNICANFICP